MSGDCCMALLCPSGTSTWGSLMPPRAMSLSSRTIAGGSPPKVIRGWTGGGVPSTQPGLQMMQGRVDHRRHGDLVDGLHGLVVQRNGEAEVPLHAR